MSAGRPEAELFDQLGFFKTFYRELVGLVTN